MPPISEAQIEKISYQVIKVLVTRFESFPKDASENRNAPFHTAFLNAFADKFQGKVSDIPFFISLSSWLQGLNTTLGQNFFENVSHILCDGDKREYTSKKRGNLPISKLQKESVGNLVTELSTGKRKPNLDQENITLFKAENELTESAIDFSADVFYEEDDEITAIELKSVRPNSGEMRGEKQKILEGKAALFNKFNGKSVRFYIGFPFDPTNETSPTGYDTDRFLGSIINMNKYFDKREVLIASQLWTFLSGEGATMEKLLEIINTIATTQFMDRFTFINDNQNREANSRLYKQYLSEWNLFSELGLLNHEQEIKSRIIGDKRLTKVHNQIPFDKEGNYNLDRFEMLNKLLHE